LRRSARGIFAARGQIDPFDRRSCQPQPISRFSCSIPPGRVHKQRTNCNRSGRPLGLSGWFYIPWHPQTLGRPLRVVATASPMHTHVAYQCKPLSLLWTTRSYSSGPPGRLSACDRSLDSHSGPLRSSLQAWPLSTAGMNTSVHSRYLVCPVAHHSGHHRPASHVDIPLRALSSRARCRSSGNRVTVDIFVHTAPDSFVRASILDLSVTASHHLTTDHVSLLADDRRAHHPQA
jgi:hypothetical protein